MAIILAQILAQMRGGQNLRWALDLAVSTFAAIRFSMTGGWNL